MIMLCVFSGERAGQIAAAEQQHYFKSRGIYVWLVISDQHGNLLRLLHSHA